MEPGKAGEANQTRAEEKYSDEGRSGPSRVSREREREAGREAGGSRVV